MAKIYTVTAPDGHDIDIEGPEGATADEVIAQAHALYAPIMEARDAQRKAYPTSAEQGGPPGQAIQSSFNLPEIAKGVGQSIANTGLAALQWGQNVVGAHVTPTPPSFQPKNEGQRLGNTVGYVATSALPAAVTAGASLPIQVAAGGLGMGLAAAGANEDPQTASTIGMALPVAGQLISAAGKVIPRKMAQTANEWMGVHPKWVEHGANPGKRLVDEGILSGTREDIKSQVDDKLEDVGRELQVRLLQGKQSSIDGEAIVMSALNKATKRIGIGSDPAFQNRLVTTLDDILARTPNLKTLSPADANALKTAIGDSIKWTGTPYEGEINQALVEMYGGLNGAIKSNIPGIDKTLARYSDLKVAQNALAETIRKEQVSTGLTRGLGTAMTKTAAKTAAPVVGAGAVALGAKKASNYFGY